MTSDKGLIDVTFKHLALLPLAQGCCGSPCLLLPCPSLAQGQGLAGPLFFVSCAPVASTSECINGLVHEEVTGMSARSLIKAVTLVTCVPFCGAMF